jgi:hypothetical protein
MDLIRDYIKQSSNVKTTQRLHLLEGVLEVIERKELPEAAVKPLMFTLTNSLFYYKDVRSKDLTCQVMKG